MHKVLAFLLVAYTPIVWGTDIDIGWKLPTVREDGTPLEVTEILQYNLYQDGVLIQEIPDPNQLTTVVPYTGTGQPCFRLTTVDTLGQEGAQSEALCVEVKPAAPAQAELISIGIRK